MKKMVWEARVALTCFMFAAFVIGIAIGFNGCATWGPSVCDTTPDGDSVLCSIATKNNLRLESVGDILMVVNLRAIKEGAYTAEGATKVFERFRKAINTQVSTTMLRDAVMRYVAEYPELLIVSGYLNYLGDTTVQLIKEKDVEMLNSWIDQQVRMMGGSA